MKIELHEVPVQDVVQYSKHLMECQGYKDDGENGVVGMGGTLDIRPTYQREFIYKGPDRDAVIETITKGFPLNVLYWVVKYDGSFEVLDGQQRLMSICKFVSNKFSFNKLYFNNMPEDQQEQILNYKLMVYFCEGTDSEKLNWFRIVNIAGKRLTEQELRNAVYAGSWVSDVKRYFSRTGCVAYQLAANYIKGVAIRQDYLETAIKWINNGNIEDYMAKHQFDDNAKELWSYFQNVINWAQTLFPKYRREMKGLPWGKLYNTYKDVEYDPEETELLVAKFMADEDVKKKSGIYEYTLTGDEKKLNIRAFDLRQRREAYERQSGICTHCNEQFRFGEMEADHITPWVKGGKTIAENCQMLCLQCNRTKSAK